MKKLLFISLLLASNCFAIDPYTILIPQVDPTGSFQQTRLIAKPADSAYLWYNPSTNIPEWGLVSALTMTSTQISDTSSVGRGLMSAANAAAARSTIGAGTSNFSGDYNDLTNRITNNNQLTNGAAFVTAITAPVTSVNSLTGAVTLNAASVGAAAASHTHTASQISDRTTIGRSLLTASNQAAVQSIVGVSSPTARSFNYTTRSLDTCFQPSSSRDAQVSYNAEIVSSGTLVGGQQGTVYLETFTNSGCTTGTQEIGRSTNGNTTALIVAIGNVSTTTLNLNGIIPAGLYVKIRTQNNTGTPSFTARPGQETLL